MALGACGSSQDSSFGNNGGGDGGNGSDASAGGGFNGGGGGGAGDCPAEAKNYVYVISAERALYRFAPDQKKFDKVGDLRCTNSTRSMPNSMAIDRSGQAWVNYITLDGSGAVVGGAIYRVSVLDASCDVGSMFALPKAWMRIGMGYSTDSSTAKTETLFIASTSGTSHNLGRLDVATKAVAPLGSFVPQNPFASLNAELTGTGDARLYGMFIQVSAGANRPSPIVGLIDKSSASAESPVDMSGVEAPNAWAFSFWGGHFYLYTSPWHDPTRTSNVTDFDPVSGNIDASYMGNVGFNIVGAGVSTCAPTTPPPIH